MTGQSDSYLPSPSSDRYARQIRFGRIGEEGQRRLGTSRAAVVGLGALGCVSAHHLARSGVGYIRLIDRDIVEWTNLQRQMLYDEQDAASCLPKAAAAADRLRAINGSIEIEAHAADLTAASAEELLGGVDLIIDGSDNFSARYLINDYSVKHGVPWIYGGVVGASGVTATILPGESPCYRCLYPTMPAPGTADTCETAGVLSPAVDIVGSVQAAEALKLLSGNAGALHGTLFQIDLWNHHWLPIASSGSKRSDCPACGQRRFEFLEPADEAQSAVSLCGRQSVHVSPGVKTALDLDGIAARLSALGHLEQNKFLLRLRYKEGMTFVLFGDGRAIVQGTDDLTKARSIYAELLGI